MKIYESEYQAPVENFESKKDHSVTITRNDKGYFIVEGDWLYKFMGSINFDDRESLRYFEKVLRSSGVIEALENAGCTDGDTVSILDFEFDFVK